MTSLDPATPPVNPPRRYDSARRRQQAERSRRAVIDTARELFLRDGYGATTIAAIAKAAGVSPESIYKGFGSKPGLLRAIRETALGGAGTVPAERRSDAALETETDPRAIFTTWASLATEVAPRVAPVLLLVRAAAAVDPTLVPLEREMDESRLERMAHLAAGLIKRGHVRPGLDANAVRDILFTYTAPELFQTLVLGRGWALEDFGRFIADGLSGSLLPHS